MNFDSELQITGKEIAYMRYDQTLDYLQQAHLQFQNALAIEDVLPEVNPHSLESATAHLYSAVEQMAKIWRSVERYPETWYEDKHPTKFSDGTSIADLFLPEHIPIQSIGMMNFLVGRALYEQGLADEARGRPKLAKGLFTTSAQLDYSLVSLDEYLNTSEVHVKR